LTKKNKELSDKVDELTKEVMNVRPKNGGSNKRRKTHKRKKN
jgi:hypothetical protein